MLNTRAFRAAICVTGVILLVSIGLCVLAGYYAFVVVFTGFVGLIAYLAAIVRIGHWAGDLSGRRPFPASAFAVIYCIVILAATAACTAQQQQAVAAFEAKAAPAIAQGCATFRSAESNPLVSLAVAGGTLLANAETGGLAGPAIASLKGFGDSFCQNGPPAGDATSTAQRAAWIAGVAQQLAAGVGGR